MRTRFSQLLVCVVVILALSKLIATVPSLPGYPDQHVEAIATSIANTQFNDPKDRVTQEIALRQYQTDGEVKVWTTLFQGFGAAALIAGAVLTWRNFLVSRKTLEVAENRLAIDKDTLQATEHRLEIDRQSQVSNRYLQATLQLGAQLQDGNPNLELRLGAIDELQQLASDSTLHRPRVLSRLATYVRENAAWNTPASDSPSTSALDLLGPEAGEERSRRWSDPISSRRWKPRSDIQFALTVLGSMSMTSDETSEITVDLSGSDLRGANLGGLHFERANLAYVHLEDAFLERTHFEEARLRNSCFAGAFLARAHLELANLVGAQLDAAYCERANFDQAVFTSASLRNAYLGESWLVGADFYDADLAEARMNRAFVMQARFTGSRNLTQAQLRVTRDGRNAAEEDDDLSD